MTIKLNDQIKCDEEWWVCHCGNQPNYEGFYSCTTEGKIISPELGGLWDGIKYVCYRCYRIINGDTCEVLGKAVPSAIEYNEEYDWADY